MVGPHQDADRGFNMRLRHPKAGNVNGANVWNLNFESSFTLDP